MFVAGRTARLSHRRAAPAAMQRRRFDSAHPTASHDRDERVLNRRLVEKGVTPITCAVPSCVQLCTARGRGPRGGAPSATPEVRVLSASQARGVTASIASSNLAVMNNDSCWACLVPVRKPVTVTVTASPRKCDDSQRPGDSHELMRFVTKFTTFNTGVTPWFGGFAMSCGPESVGYLTERSAVRLRSLSPRRRVSTGRARTTTAGDHDEKIDRLRAGARDGLRESARRKAREVAGSSLARPPPMASGR